ncbi:MAG: hypothetical protein R3Y26_08775 [Rikenellaceae bacterium]
MKTLFYLLFILVSFVSCEKNKWLPGFEVEKYLYILIEDGEENNLLETEISEGNVRVGFSTSDEFEKFYSATYTEHCIVDTLGMKLLKMTPIPESNTFITTFVKFGNYETDTITWSESSRGSYVIGKAWYNGELVYDEENLTAIQQETSLHVIEVTK